MNLKKLYPSKLFSDNINNTININIDKINNNSKRNKINTKTNKHYYLNSYNININILTNTIYFKKSTHIGTMQLNHVTVCANGGERWRLFVLVVIFKVDFDSWQGDCWQPCGTSGLRNNRLVLIVNIIPFFFTPSTLVLLGAPHVPIKTVQWSKSSAALAGSVHRLSRPSLVFILGQVKRWWVSWMFVWQSGHGGEG